MMARGGDARSSRFDGKSIYQTLATTMMMDANATQVTLGEN